LQFELTRLDLVQLVEQAVTANRVYARQFGVRLMTDVPDLRIEVTTDHDRLTQVITNLLSNAIKFSPQGGEVKVVVKTFDDRVRVAVTDQGPGIPRQFHEHLFDKFTQAEASDNRRAGGTGLGLSISRAIMRELGGEVGFETGSGGTTMYFELPQQSLRTSDATGPGTAAAGAGPGSAR
jgi:signal transduction histidine kinase